jgi:PAS domain S-box-containing protein
VAKLILRLEKLPGAAAEPDTPYPQADPPAPAREPDPPQRRVEVPTRAPDAPPRRDVVDLGDNGRPPAASTPLARWSAAVAAAHDPCVVLDVQGQVLSLSVSGAELLGCSDAGVIGRRLLDVLHLVDFETGALDPDYAARIAPLAVLQPGSGLMRSLLRVRTRDGGRLTVDASSAPLHDVRGETIGSLTFLAPVRG